MEWYDVVRHSMVWYGYLGSGSTPESPKWAVHLRGRCRRCSANLPPIFSLVFGWKHGHENNLEEVPAAASRAVRDLCEY